MEEQSPEQSPEQSLEPSYQPSPDSIADPFRVAAPSTVVVGEVPAMPAPPEPGATTPDPVVPDCLVKVRITPEDSGVPEQNRYKGIWTAYFVQKEWCNVKGNRQKLPNIFPSFYLINLSLSPLFTGATSEFNAQWALLASTHYLLVPIRLLRRRGEPYDLAPTNVELIGMKLNQHCSTAEGHILYNNSMQVVDRCFNGVWVPHPSSRGYRNMASSYGTDRLMLESYKRGAKAIDEFVVESINKLGWISQEGA
jgi:hypothetical protein